MKGTVKLRNAIKIDGKNIKALDYDTEEINGDLFIKACSLANQEAAQNSSITGLMPAVDYSVQLMLGLASAEAVNPDADMLTLKRHIKGSFDIMAFVGIGRNFTMLLEDRQEDSSEEPIETTAEPSTPQ